MPTKTTLKTSGGAMEPDLAAREVERTTPQPRDDEPKTTPKPKPVAKPSAEDKKRAALAAKVVKLRDEQEKPWKVIGEATGLNGGQLRRYYNAGRKAAQKGDES